MTITNKMNLPEAMVRACETKAHNSSGYLSATTLLKGVKETILTHRHWNEFTDDVSDRIWAIFGTAVHSMLEHDSPDTFTEENVSVEIPNTGYTVTGRIDCYDMKAGSIEDYKTASCWKVIYKDFDDWYKQGMIYAYLMKANGFDVTRCRFIAMLKDWSKSKARHDASYPQSPVYVYEFKTTEKDFADIEVFIVQKVNAIKLCDDFSDDEITECTKEERWAKGDVYAVMKEGRKSALKLFNNKQDAYAFLGIQEKGKCKVEKREAVSTKCMEYCSACEFCNFYKSIKGDE
jgi:hypothetical protein